MLSNFFNNDNSEKNKLIEELQNQVATLQNKSADQKIFQANDLSQEFQKQIKKVESDSVANN